MSLTLSYFTHLFYEDKLQVHGTYYVNFLHVYKKITCMITWIYKILWTLYQNIYQLYHIFLNNVHRVWNFKSRSLCLNNFSTIKIVFFFFFYHVLYSSFCNIDGIRLLTIIWRHLTFATQSNLILISWI